MLQSQQRRLKWSGQEVGRKLGKCVKKYFKKENVTNYVKCCLPSPCTTENRPIDLAMQKAFIALLENYFSHFYSSLQISSTSSLSANDLYLFQCENRNKQKRI